MLKAPIAPFAQVSAPVGDLPAGPKEIYRRALTSSQGYLVLGDRLILWCRGGQLVFRHAGT